MKIGKVIKRNITIEPSMNMGFIVHIGCARFVAADKATLIAELNEYLSDPEKYEELYGECGVILDLYPGSAPDEQAETVGRERPRAPGVGTDDQPDSPG